MVGVLTGLAGGAAARGSAGRLHGAADEHGEAQHEALEPGGRVLHVKHGRKLLQACTWPTTAAQCSPLVRAVHKAVLHSLHDRMAGKQ